MYNLKYLFFVLSLFSIVTCYGQRVEVSLKSLQRITDGKILQAKLDSLEKGNEDDLNLLANFFRTNRDEEKMDAVIALATERFPLGKLAFVKSIAEVKDLKSPIEQKMKFLAIRDKFAGFLGDEEFQRLCGMLVIKNLTLKPLDNALFYLDFISDPKIFSAMVYFIYASDPVKGRDVMKTFILKNSHRPGIEAVQAQYVHALLAAGDINEASKYAAQAYPKSENNREFLADYVKILNLEGNARKALAVQEKMVVYGFGTESLRTLLKNEYRKMGFDGDAKMAALLKEQNEHYKSVIVEKMLDLPAPQFTVKDVHGNPVALSDFKGRTIVLDFWATWCAPCKASFPTMQKVVEAFKDDKEVKFLFVHTWERGNTRALEEASSYLKTNKYTFDLFMDYANPLTRVNPTISSFGVEGIPTKFVIDGNGIIRFKTLGSGGNETEDIHEISTMIEIAKSHLVK